MTTHLLWILSRKEDITRILYQGPTAMDICWYNWTLTSSWWRLLIVYRWFCSSSLQSSRLFTFSNASNYIKNKNAPFSPFFSKSSTRSTYKDLLVRYVLTDLHEELKRVKSFIRCRAKLGPDWDNYLHKHKQKGKKKYLHFSINAGHPERIMFTSSLCIWHHSGQLVGRLTISWPELRHFLLRLAETNVDHKSGIWLAWGHRQVYSYSGGRGMVGVPLCGLVESLKWAACH